MNGSVQRFARRSSACLELLAACLTLALVGAAPVGASPTTSVVMFSDRGDYIEGGQPGTNAPGAPESGLLAFAGAGTSVPRRSP